MTSSGGTRGNAEGAIERAVVYNFAIHGIAIVAMVVLLLPMMPGGVATSELARIAAIAEHPWRFRLGWLPWQLCAVSDLYLAVAMVRTAWLPRGAALAVLLLTVAAVIPDQYAQALWITRGVELAAGDPSAYLAFEHAIFPLTAAWAALGYTFAALGWTACFARAGTWSRALTVLSVPLWLVMLVATCAPLLPSPPSPRFVSTANGIGFVLLQLWLGLVAEQVLRRRRPFEAHGRLARWRHPARNPLARLADVVANSRLCAMILEPLPQFAMRSDVTDIVYVNYLVDAERVTSLVPPGLELQRLGPDGKYALFTHLTFRHGHFGLALMGPLRRFTASPVQTNWRIHVRDPRTGYAGIYFVTNAIARTLPALAARLLTEGMPMHVPLRAVIESTDKLRVTVDPGSGSAPDLALALAPCDPPVFTGAWAACWPDYAAFLAYCVPQERALSSQPQKHRISRQEITLGIPFEMCKPVSGSVESRAARAIAGDAEPLCFHVASGSFLFTGERHDVLPP